MIAIIGGGPAGIALARQLDRRGIHWTLFEAERIAATWRKTPEWLTVLSPWWTNIIAPAGLLQRWPLEKAPAGHLRDHLLTVAARLNGTVYENTPIQRLARADDGAWWAEGVNLERWGLFTAVVLATGYFSAPRPPHPEFITDASRPVVHAGHITSRQQLLALSDATTAPVLVVGRRVTAGQMLQTLRQHRCPVALSIRSPLEFRRSGALAWLREMAYYAWEELEALRKPGLKRHSYPPMEGGKLRRWIESGAIPVYGPPTRLTDGVVHFSDGRSLPVSAVILATGYDPCVQPFTEWLDWPADQRPRTRGAFESAIADNLFLLGYDNLYDHRSRYLRGIRQDAKRLADQLVERFPPRPTRRAAHAR